ncbi:hypothetical protein F4780DRAFT_43960 [Xylariomycetidae sp. FL0641]|nr:hypothetical protein F4780DRAFT_43960 [Xylariomycetidae sp. FL0641]
MVCRPSLLSDQCFPQYRRLGRPGGQNDETSSACQDSYTPSQWRRGPLDRVFPVRNRPTSEVHVKLKYQHCRLEPTAGARRPFLCNAGRAVGNVIGGPGRRSTDQKTDDDSVIRLPAGVLPAGQAGLPPESRHTQSSGSQSNRNVALIVSYSAMSSMYEPSVSACLASLPGHHVTVVFLNSHCRQRVSTSRRGLPVPENLEVPNEASSPRRDNPEASRPRSTDNGVRRGSCVGFAW